MFTQIVTCVKILSIFCACVCRLVCVAVCVYVVIMHDCVQIHVESRTVLFLRCCPALCDGWLYLSAWHNLESSVKGVSVRNRMDWVGLWVCVCEIYSYLELADNNQFLNWAGKTHLEYGWHHFMGRDQTCGKVRVSWAHVCNPLSLLWTVDIMWPAASGPVTCLLCCDDCDRNCKSSKALSALSYLCQGVSPQQQRIKLIP